jgi:hypothetical protein
MIVGKKVAAREETRNMMHELYQFICAGLCECHFTTTLILPTLLKFKEKKLKRKRRKNDDDDETDVIEDRNDL